MPLGLVMPVSTGGDLARLDVDAGHLLGLRFGDEDEAVGGHRQIVGRDAAGDDVDRGGLDVDRDHAVLRTLAAVKQTIRARISVR